MSSLDDERFLNSLGHGGESPIEWYFIDREVLADAEIIGCWTVDYGVWDFVPLDLNPHSLEYSELRDFLRTRGNPVFASSDDVYEHARKVGWPNADKWSPS